MAPSATASEPGVSQLRRPLSSTENLWFRAHNTGTGIVILGLVFSQRLQLAHVQEAINAAQAHQPLMACKIVKDGRGGLDFVHSEEINSPLVVAKEWTPTGKGDGEEDAAVPAVQQILEESMSELMTDGSTGDADVMQVHVYPSAIPGSTLVVFRVIACSMDVHSVNVICQLFLTALAQVTAGNPTARPSEEAQALPAEMAKLIPRDVGSKNFFSRGLGMLGYVADNKRSALLPLDPATADSRTNTFRSQYVPLVLDKATTEKLLATCSERGVLLYSCQVAALLKATAAFKEIKGNVETFAVTTIFNCRPFLDPPVEEQDVGLYTGALPITEKVAESTPFWELAEKLSRRVEEDTAQRKQFTEMPTLDMLFSTAISRPSVTPHTSLRTSLLSSYAGAPQLAQWKGVESLKLTATVGPTVAVHGVGPCIGILDSLQEGPEGPELHMYLAYAAPVFSRRVVQRIASLAEEALTTALAFSSE